MYDINIVDDEPPATDTEIHQLEQALGNTLPDEYAEFLKQHNGCVIYPNVPKISADTRMEIWAVERFLSAGDILLQSQTQVQYVDIDCIKEYDGDKYPVDIDKLITFALSERGAYHLYLGDEDKGRIYSTCYSDGDGLVRFNSVSFNAFIDSLEAYDDEGIWQPQIDNSSKVFDSHLFITPNNPSLGLERFKTVLSYYGDPNISPGEGYKNVTETYVHNHLFLEHILSQGGRTEGLLNSCRNFDTVLLLVNQYNEDINKPYNGKYPIFSYMSGLSPHDYKIAYELMDNILQSDIDVDLSVKDPSGNDVKTRLNRVNEGYLKYLSYESRTKEAFYSEAIASILKEQ